MAILDSDVSRAIYDSEASSGFDPVPDGEYEFSISKTEVKETNNRAGLYVQIEFTIERPKFQGRKIWENFNIRNQSQKAESIGRSQLKALCLACGIDGPLHDTDDLRNRHVLGTVYTEPSKDPHWNDKNRIKKFKLVGGHVAPATTATAPGQFTAPAGGFAAPTNYGAPAPTSTPIPPSAPVQNTMDFPPLGGVGTPPMQQQPTMQQQTAPAPVQQPASDNGAGLPWG